MRQSRRWNYLNQTSDMPTPSPNIDAMIRVAPAPGELAKAHEGRIGQQYFCKTQIDAQNLLNAKPAKIKGRRTPRRICRLENLAIYSGMSVSDYAKQHSMLSTFQFASQNTARYGEGAHSGAFIDMKTPRPGAYCCIDCIKEDMSFWKYSWFRRWHNQIGVDWCQLHGRKLSIVANTQPYMRAPNEWLAIDALYEVEAEYHQLPNSGIIRRYVDISTALLDQDRPLKQALINRHLGKVARSIGLAKPVENPKLLSSFLQNQTHAKWFAANFNDYKYKDKPARYFDWIPVRLDRGYMSHIYALVLAGLYDSSDDALNTIHFIGKKWQDDSNDEQLLSEQELALDRNLEPLSHDPRLVISMKKFLSGVGFAEACSMTGAVIEDFENFLRKNVRESIV